MNKYKNSLNEETQGLVSNGIYSVMQNKWIKEPVQQNIPDIDKDKFDELFNEWEDKYFDLIDKIDQVDEKEITEGILVEGTKYDKLASKIISDSGLFDEETSDKIIQALFKEDIHAFTHAPSWLEKYLKGIARMIVQESNGDRQRAQSFLSECPSIFDEYLTWIKENRTEENKSKLDSEFIDRMSYQDVKDFLDKIQSQRDEKSKDELSKMEFGNSNFSLIPINSYEEMHRLYGGRATGDGSSDQYAGGGGTAWCHTNSKDVYDSWVKNGGKFFVLQNNDWQNIPFNKESNENNPKDDYGNSLIALLVSRTGKLKNATLRCNHVGVPSSADNQYHTYAELSRVAGFNVEEEVGKYIEPSELTPQDVLNISFDGEVCFGIITEFQDEVEEVIIPDGVKAIGSYAFMNCETLTKVKIPNSVEKVGYRAFAKSGIESIEIPDSVKLMGTAVFDGCSRLKNVKLSNNLDGIGETAFRGCKVLEHIEIPTSVKVIGDWAFSECDSLRSVVIPNEVKLINDYAFSSCSNLQKVSILSDYINFGEGVFNECVGLSQINLPNLDNIPPYFLYNTRIQSINIPNGVQEIGGGAFARCNKLVNVNIPNSVKSIYNSAFESCKALRKISIPNSVQEMGTRAFEDCDQALVVYTDSDAVRGALIDNIWFPGQVKPMSEYNESLGTISNEQLNEVYPNKGENKKDFISRFMSVTKDEYPDQKQRYAVALSYWNRRNKNKNESMTIDDDIENVKKFLLNIDEEDMFQDEFEKDTIIGPYDVQVWSHLSHFGSAWIPKPVVAIQIDREDKPNGFISYGDIESINEYRYAVDTLVEKMYEKI